ncbi:MAG: NAD+ synthase [Armatimonadota bacterium]
MQEKGSGFIRLALAQLNFTVGDIEGNTKKIIENIEIAKKRGADIVVFPELAITGYPPEDLLLKKSFVKDNLDAISRITQSTKGITCIVGFVDVEDDIYNAAAVLHDGELAGVHHKYHLPNYGVFDEIRYFQYGRTKNVFKIKDFVFGVEICEDTWHANGPHVFQTLYGGAQMVISINSSPFYSGKWMYRERMLCSRAYDNTCVMVYLNTVGGQDELVFDGQSMIAGPSGDIVFRCKAFEEQLAITDIDLGPVNHKRLIDTRRRSAKLAGECCEVNQISLDPVPAKDISFKPTQTSEPPNVYREIYTALVVGTRDYVNKNGFAGVVLGLSGGIDSALTVTIAYDALGPDRVRALIMPSMYSSKETMSDAELLAQNLGIRYDRIPISEPYSDYIRILSDVFEGTSQDTTEENLQARIRGNLLMAVSNKFGLLVLTTGNKSELACGYSTLYGDMAGGFAVIKDVPKTLVFKLAEYRNNLNYVIPHTIITRPPTAELKPNQTDQDTLPPYEILDPILMAYVEEDRSIDEIVSMGFDQETVKRVVKMVDTNEYKRRQSPIGIKITPKAFGRDRRLPITNKYKEYEFRG